MAKIINSAEAAQLIQDGDVVGINGFAFGFGFPESLAKALGGRYRREGSPRGLTLMFASGCGDSGAAISAWIILPRTGWWTKSSPATSVWPKS